MSVVLFNITFGLFALKVLWNVSVPYWLLLGTADQRSAVSLMPYVEVGLLLIAVVLALIGGLDWPWSPGGVALFGSAAIVGSYAQFFVVASAYWVVRRLRPRR